MQPRLSPPQTKGHISVARLARYWYVACRSSELQTRPIARTLLGTPVVLFRDGSGHAAALVDRCPHRNVPLSLGRVVEGGRLECAYHGWQFDGQGRCRLIPGMLDGSVERERRAQQFAVREQDGFVWVFAEPDAEPNCEPFRVPQVSSEYAVVERDVSAEGTLHATIENALDVPHTAFLHRGLFRGGKRNEITAVVRRFSDHVEAEYIGEPRPSGIAGRVLSPSGGNVEHWDRFFLPSVAQVEYRLGTETHFLVTAICTPVSDFETKLFAVAQFKTRLPANMVKRVLEPFALRIFGQDAKMLKAQSENIRRFGGEQFMYTELDFLGPHIWRLLKQAEQGELSSENVVEREVRFLA
jgi:phenylpropionate dioxygenase-like ring-hydroxylating dioxygenase large terminal subunit